MVVIYMKYNRLTKVAFMLFALFILLAVKSNVYALDYVACGSATGIPKPLPQMTTIAYTFLIVGAPVVLIISAVITLIKANASGNPDNILKAKDKLFKKFILTGFIFLIAGVVQFAITRVTSTNSDKATVGKCMSCFLYFSNCNDSDSGNDVFDG